MIDTLTPAAILTTVSGKHPFLTTNTGARWSYGELRSDVESRRQLLTSWGVASGSRVALQVPDPGESVLWFLALLAHDAVAVPINPHAPPNEVQRTIQKSGAAFLFDGESVPRVMADPQEAVGPAEAGLILLTSGSTGDPKPVGLPWSSLWHTAQQVAIAHHLTPDDIGFSPLPLFHINALVVGVLANLATGSHLLIADRFHASNFWEMADTHQVTWINAVPALLGVLAQRPEEPQHPERIRFIRSASAPLPASLRHKIETRFRIPVVETYGMTEAASQITANPLPGEGLRAGSVGVPRGIEVRIVDKRGRTLMAGQRGFVEIRGPSVIKPGWGPNEWAEADMHDGWYPTGDVGRLDDDGYLFLAGRGRDLINRGGEKIFPREVEDWLSQCPGLSECAVVGRPHPVLGEEPVAFVTPQDDRQLTVEHLKNWARRGLARFKQPAEYFVLPTLPKGATGKILRPLLKRQAREGRKP